MADRIEQLEAFVAVAELHGFASAARKLKLSAPKLTRLVAALEQRLGVSLFRRTTRAVAMTDDGARLLPKAKAIVEALQEAEAATRAERPTPAGRFSVTAPVVFGRRYVAPVFSKFLAAHPDVRGELVLVDRLVNLVEEGVDVAVRIGTLEDSNLRVRHVGVTRRVVIASPAYLKRNGRPRTPDALRAHSTIVLTGIGAQREWRFGRQRVPLAPVFTTNSADAAIEHALSDGGLAMVLGYQVADLVARGQLEVVLKQFEPPPSPIQLVYAETRIPSATVRAFIDFAVSRLATKA
jgi:DNA-binding transcriptional LysR family regulator